MSGKSSSDKSLNDEFDSCGLPLVESLLPIESWICPICHDPLLDPVMVDDGFVYNKNCFIKYLSTKKRKKIHQSNV